MENNRFKKEDLENILLNIKPRRTGRSFSLITGSEGYKAFEQAMIISRIQTQISLLKNKELKNKLTVLLESNDNYNITLIEQILKNYDK